MVETHRAQQNQLKNWLQEGLVQSSFVKTGLRGTGLRELGSKTAVPVELDRRGCHKELREIQTKHRLQENEPGIDTK